MADMLELILKSLWVFLPAGISNMSPVLFKWFPFLDTPVDLNIKFRGHRLFGKNKTYRGVLFGVLMSIICVYIQKKLYENTRSLCIIDYTQINVCLLGFLLGFGALFGDLIESFFKRQFCIAPGKPWVPFDQIDWILGAIVFVRLYINISWVYMLTGLLLFGLLHPVINILGYILGIKKNMF